MFHKKKVFLEDIKFCSVSGISVYVFIYSSYRNVILFETFGRIHIYSGLYHVYHVYILHVERFFQKSQRGRGRRFSCKNEGRGCLYRRCLSIEGRVKHCFSFVMFGFCSNNALYSANLLFKMFILLLSPIDNRDWYHFKSIWCCL